MRTFTPEFAQALFEERNPVVVARIETSTRDIWLTSHQVTVPSAVVDIVIQSCIVSATGASQDITPERGFSTIGSQSIVFSDVGFTDALRDLLLNNNRTIYNAKTTTYWGLEGLDFTYFAYAPPMYVMNVENDELSYTLTLNDAQRFTKKSAFGDRPTAVVLSGIGTGNGTLGVNSTAGFDLVQHGDDWFGNAPNSMAGYLKVKGTFEGEDVVEYLRYNSKTATTFNIVERGVFGTRTIDLKSSTGNSKVEVEEVVYLALPAPKMILALLTNDLYGQVGQTIPSHWGANISSLLVDVASFEPENVGDDIWGIDLEFIDLEETDIKRFLAEQCLSVLNLYLRIDAEGELSLERFGSLSDSSPSGTLITYENMLDAPKISRDVQHIRNNFLIKWEYRPNEERYARSQIYIDDDSITRNEGYISQAKIVELRGIRNISRYSGLTVNLLAQSIRARFSDAAITFTANILMRDSAKIEVGDIVTVALEKQPFESSDEYFQGAMEVQGITWDFLGGTASLKLFTNTGRATGLTLEEGDDALDPIDHTGWTKLATGSLGTVAGNDFLVANGASFPEGKYWFDGDIVFDAIATPSFQCFINRSVVFDCRDFEMRGSAKINGVARGIAGQQGGYGGDDTGDNGLYVGRTNKILFSDYYYQHRERNSTVGAFVPMKDPNLQSIKPRVDRTNKLIGLPLKLYGNGSARGGQREDWDGSVILGGAAAAGGAGLAVVCENFIYDSLNYDPVIDTSGGNGSGGSSVTVSGAGSFWSGRSGFGWPGLLLAFIKNSSSPKPILTDIHVAKIGETSTLGGTYPSNGDRNYRTIGGTNYIPRSNNFNLRATLKGRDVAKEQPVNLATYVKKDSDSAPVAGVDVPKSAQAATLVLQEALNTPETPKGDQSTITVTAVPQVDDTGFQYALFEYRLQGKQQWVPIAYDIRTEATVTVTSSGDTYEFRATSYNNVGRAGGTTVESITVTNVNRNTDTSAGGQVGAPAEITVPSIKRLELVNRIIEDVWDKFKSGNAEFRWAKLSNTLGGSIIQLNGTTDLHFQGYNIRIKDVSGKILREEQVRDSFYTYTYDENKKDTGGNPVRKFKFEVQAVATTGHVSAWNGFEVENPAPAAPSGIAFEVSYTTIAIRFNLPTDVDFVGVDLFFVEGAGDPYAATPRRLSGNSALLEGLNQNTQYTIGLRSVDQFGTGGQVSAFSVTTNDLNAADVTGLGAWATEDEVSAAFVSQYMASGSISSALIAQNAVIAEKIAVGAVES